MSDKKNEQHGEKAHFDMYHFFSRKDVMLIIVFLIAFLIFTVALFFHPQAA